jgi:hypothetical protein
MPDHNVLFDAKAGLTVAATLAKALSLAEAMQHMNVPRAQMSIQRFAAGYPASGKLSEILLHLNETSLSQLRRDYETGHLDHKITKGSK